MSQLCQTSRKFGFFQRFQCPNWWAVRHSQSPAKSSPPCEPFHHPGVQDFTLNHSHALSSAERLMNSPKPNPSTFSLPQPCSILLRAMIYWGAAGSGPQPCSEPQQGPGKQILAENLFPCRQKKLAQKIPSRSCSASQEPRRYPAWGNECRRGAAVHRRFGEGKTKIKQRFAASFYQTSSVWCVCKALALAEWHMSIFTLSREGAQGKELPVWQILTFPAKQWIAWVSKWKWKWKLKKNLKIYILIITTIF